MEGRVQSFHAVVKPQGEARPGWKVLRMLGSMLGLAGFDADTIEDGARGHRAGPAGVGATPGSRNAMAPFAFTLAAPAAGLERVAEWPIYGTRSAGAPRAEPAEDRRRARPPRPRA